MTSILARWAWLAATLAVAAGCLAFVVPHAAAEQASSETRRAQGGFIDAGEEHTCALLVDRSVRCWGEGTAGRLGYGNEVTLLAPGGPVNLGAGRAPRALAAGDFHTCAILDDGSVRCWGFGANGRLGYGNTASVLSPSAAPPVDLGAGRTATAITAGASHTCVILDTGAVRCWGNGAAGRLGYGNQESIGDNETPAAPGVVNLGPGRTARAIAAGDFHTCAILDDRSMRCWGFGGSGQLGYGGPDPGSGGSPASIGDDETPAAAGPVPITAGRTVRAVAGGTGHTCAVYDDATVHCWGFGANGRLGYGNGDHLTSASEAGPVSLGPGRTAIAIAVADAHSCAVLDDGAVRCWGVGANGRLGYGNTTSIGDNELPSSAGPVDLGAGRSARAITAGFDHTCALLDDGSARCWGFGGNGRLGNGGTSSVGDTEVPGAVGPTVAPGGLASSVADLSLAMAAGATQVALGSVVAITLTVANAGTDPAAGVAIAIPRPTGLSFETAAVTQGGFDGSRWQVGSLPPGSSAVLQLTARANAPGSHVVAAEVVGSSLFDPTSTPGNGAPEDDRAVVEIMVPALPQGRIQRLRPRGLLLQVKRAPRRGPATRLTVTGRLLLPRTRPAPRCGGRVLVRATVGRRTVASRKVALRRRKGVCSFSTVLRPKRTRSARTVQVSGRFLGTSQMQPRASRALRVRIR